MASTELVPLAVGESRPWPAAFGEALADAAPVCEFSGLKNYGCAHCSGVVPDFDIEEVQG